MARIEENQRAFAGYSNLAEGLALCHLMIQNALLPTTITGLMPVAKRSRIAPEAMLS